jgi:hypothetical protein
MELSDVSADAGGCSISFHWRFDTGNQSQTGIVEKDSEVFLKLVQEITVTQWDLLLQQGSAKAGHPEVSVSVEPAVFLVVLKATAGSPSTQNMRFNFYDEDMANRVAKALQHAVDLCGGGHQEPF